MEKAEVPVQTENKPSLGTVDIAVDQHIVRVSWAQFKEGLGDPAAAIIYLPGWPWKADQLVTFGISSSLAARSGVRTFSIDTRGIGQVGEEALYLEAAGIAKFLQSQGIKKTTIVGHSEGAIRAANLAAILEKDDPESVNGVVLINPMGMDNRSLKELAGGFITDVVKVFGEERKKAEIGSPEGLVIQFVQSLLRDIALAGVHYPQMLKNQLRNLVTVNPHLSELKAPVVIMATDRDLVSDLRKYLPPSDVENKQHYPQSAHDRSREEMARLSRARQQYLREKLLPNAENVVFLVGTKYADHGGIPDSRHKQVAHIIYRIFDRLKRPNSI